MGLDVPVLDDVTFAQLVEEAKKRIPQYNTGWTDYNLHDPGITLIELFAWLAESEIFFLDKVTDEHYEKFLKLLNISPQAKEHLKDAMLRAQADLRKPYKAVTLDDFEVLAKEVPEVLRVKAVWIPDSQSATTGKVEVIIVPNNLALDPGKIGQDITGAVKKKVCLYLDSRRPLTTRISVVDPEFVTVSVQALIKTKATSSATDVKNAVTDSLNRFFDPLTGYDGSGWPFGRRVYKSEVCEVIEEVNGVDCVQDLSLHVIDGGFSYDENGNVKIGKNALVIYGTHQIDLAGTQQMCRKW